MPRTAAAGIIQIFRGATYALPMRRRNISVLCNFPCVPLHTLVQRHHRDDAADICEILRRFYAAEDTNILKSFKLIYLFFLLCLFIFRCRFIPRCATTAKLMHKHCRGYHHWEKKNLKDRARSKSLIMQFFS